MLRLNAPPDRGSAHLSTRQSFHAARWEWYIRQSFAPSNNNRAFVFLNEATGELDDQPTGMAIRTGENGTPKHFRLFHFDRGSASGEWLKSDVEIQPDTGYRIRLLRTPDRQLHLYVAEGRSRTPLLQSDTAELPESFESEGHLGFLTRYTATRSNQFFFSDVLIADHLPYPRISELVISSVQEASLPYQLPWQGSGHEIILTVTFEVPPVPDAVGVPLFRLEDGTQPDDVHCGHPQICSLLFSGPLTSGEQTLITEGYQTIYGQQSDRETHSILVAARAVEGDVVINEFMYRPPATLPAYVELFNRTEKLINLRNWRLQRRAASTEPERIITTDDLYLHPGGYLVLTPVATLLENLDGAAHVRKMSAFPRFNIASTDEIRLISGTGELIDSLQYNPSIWGGFEVALERKSPDVPAWIPDNWGESLSGLGGTPGLPNSVQPPGTPPELEDIDYSRPAMITLSFSRLLDAPSLSHPDAIVLLDTGDKLTSVQDPERTHGNQGSQHYRTTAAHPGGTGSQESIAPGTTITPGVTITPGAAISPGATITPTTLRQVPVTLLPAGDRKISVIPSEPMEHGVRYLLRVSGIRDLFGNRVEETESEFRYFDIDLPFAKEVIINEVLYRPGQDHRRFVEILNRSERVFDIRGWRIGRSLGNAVSIDDSGSDRPAFLIPGEIAVISEPGLEVPGPDIQHFEITSFPSLSRFGDSVYLLAENGVVLDSVAYQPSWGGNRDGVSLERADPDGATNDPANWKEHPESHTAGLRNYHFDGLPDPVTLLRALMLDEYHVELRFNRHVILTTISEAALGQEVLEPVITATTPAHGSVFRFRSFGPIQRQFQQVRVGSVRDYAGRESGVLVSPLTFPPEPGDVIINETMYQPIAERYSNRPDQGEYVEVYNRSGLPLQLEGVYLHDRPDKEGAVRKLQPVDGELAALKPDRYAVFYADTSTTFRQSRLSRAFPASDPGQALFLRIDRQTLGLSTQGDEIYVARDDGTVLDSLWYHPSWHNPSLPDVRGISLERIDFDIATGDRRNWTSSASPDGGTPGYSNTSMVPAGVAPAAGLLLTPNPFSPNGDGNNDHLVIHYELDSPDYMIHARVFDRQGRHIRTLADGIAAGRSGKLIWDGRSDRGIMNRAGIYIIHFEAYNASGNRRRSDRAVAVLAVPL